MGPGPGRPSQSPLQNGQSHAPSLPGECHRIAHRKTRPQRWGVLVDASLRAMAPP